MRLETFVPWERKRSTLIWRGATTGTGLRREFVHRLSRHSRRDIDVRFHAYVNGRWSWLCANSQRRCGRSCCPTHLATELTRPELLRHKYLLSIEGNDVASNLKWLLGHNSVVVLPPPTIESWLLEGLLKPYVHYVPVYNASDVPRALDWMRGHDLECQRIIANANAWVERIVRDSDSEAIELLRKVRF